MAAHAECGARSWSGQVFLPLRHLQSDSSSHACVMHYPKTLEADFKAIESSQEIKRQGQKRNQTVNLGLFMPGGSDRLSTIVCLDSL